MAITYIPTGVAGLDDILQGGLISGHSYLLVGSTGTGKTILSLQCVINGTSRGEKCLYITLAEPGKEIEKNIAGFGWSLSGVDLVDLSQPNVPDEPVGEYQFFSPSEVEQDNTWQAIYHAIDKSNPQRIVIDSVTQLRYLSTDEYQYRKQIQAFVRHLNARNCTALLIYEPTAMEQEASVALAVDGIIRLRRDLSPNRAIDVRSISIEKLRGSGFLSGLHPLRITSQGINIFPHIIEELSAGKTEYKKIPSSLPQLDELLGGGIEAGTSTIITGQAGVGKSSLSMQFALGEAKKGNKALLFTLEEPEASILARYKMIGMPAEEMKEKGLLQILPINAMNIYPDELLAILRTAVESDACQTIVLDSLRGYNLAMEQFGTLIAQTQNLVNYCRRAGVTLLIVNEIEHLTGDLRLTEMGVSYLVDNVILLRYAEIDGAIIRVIGCLKKRLGYYQPELRTFSISSEGIQVGGKLSGMHGILTGVPEQRTPNER